MADEDAHRDDPEPWIRSREYDRAVKAPARTLALGSVGLLAFTVAWVSPFVAGQYPT
ncbi:MAG: hypothetical protein ACRDRJ_32130 [Streptosporangiaceae bacterium]